MIKSIILIAAMLLLAGLGLAQSAGDYRSAATGNWNQNSTWEYFNGSSWVPATATPTSASGAITIRSGHTVTVTANVTVDQVTVDSGGQVTVNNNRTLTIANGPGTDFICAGKLYNIGAINVNGTLAFYNGSIYQHARNNGTIPTASWEVNSTCLVTGVTNTGPNGLGQTFGNFTWNCPSQTQHIDANALSTIAGDLNVVNTNGFRLNNSAGDLTVYGNYNQSGGTFNPGSGYVSQRFFLGGNFNQTGGTFRNNTGGGQLIVVFSGTNQTFYSAGTMQNVIDFNIRPGTTLILNSNLPVNASATLIDSGTLYTGGYLVNGAGSFTLPAGGTLGIGSAQGITTLGTAAGSIQTTTARSYSQQANYIYNGASSQVTGNGLPAMINDLSIDNASGVTLTNSATVNGTLSLANGILNTGSNTLTVSNGGSVNRSNGWVNGNLVKYISTGAQTKTFEIGSDNGYSPVTVAFGNVTTSGTLTAKATGSVHASVYLPHQCLKRYWTLTNGGLVFDSYNATFYYLPVDFNAGFTEAADENNMVVGKFQSGSWSLPNIGVRSPGGSADGGSIQIVGQTGFSDFTLAKDGYSLDATLSVELAHFTAISSDVAITLNWRTESENGSYQWIVERSEKEAGPYVELGRLPAAGTSQTPKDYSYSDATAQAGKVYYYRLGELSQEGRIVYFGPVSCSLGCILPQADMLLGCSPNPFRQMTEIRYQISRPSQVSLKIYNVAGQCVKTLVSEFKEAGYYEARWDGRDDRGQSLSAGVYLYRISIGGRQFGGKMQLVR